MKPASDEFSMQKTADDANKSSAKGWIIIGLLILMALGLVLAPALNSDKKDGIADSSSQITQQAIDTVSAERTNTTSDNLSSISDPKTPAPQIAEAPWSESQRIAARREAQDVLAKLFDTQQELEVLRASEWAPENLAKMEALAKTGDETYQTGNFEDAVNLYEQALRSAMEIAGSAEDQATKYLMEGTNSLEENNISEAISKLELAAILDEESLEIKQTLARAEVRQQILDLDLRAKQHLEIEELESALDLLVYIKQLDPRYENIDSTITDVEGQIVERDFREAMSRGFAMLASNQLSEAESAFKQARGLKPSSEAVTRALQQVEASKINSERQRSIDQAVAFEASERWQEAASVYNGLLAKDSTLTAAQLGKIRSEARAKLDADIKRILSEPLELQSDEAWGSANATLSEAKNIISRGSILTNQISELETVVQRARTKISLQLESDTATEVEIYRVGKLGTFREQAVALYPGKYVIHGKRLGYKDVRHELVLDGMSEIVSLSVQCLERI